MPSSETYARLEYSLEYHVGLVPYNSTLSVARANSRKLRNALNAQWRGGDFLFDRGGRGPIQHPIKCSGKEFFFSLEDGPIYTSSKIGGSLFGACGSSPYPVPSDAYAANSLGGMTTIFTTIDADTSSDFIILNGSSWEVAGIEFRGRPLLTGTIDTGWTGTRPNSLIKIAGNDPPATGLHNVHRCSLNEAKYGIFVSDDPLEQHADQCIFSNIWSRGVESFYRSENQQSVGHLFNSIKVNSGGDTSDMVVFDIKKGGCITAHTVILNHNKVTVLKVASDISSPGNGEYSPNTKRFDIHGIRWDTFHNPTDYLTLFNYGGPIYTGPTDDMSALRWEVRMSGLICREYATNPWDMTKAVMLNDDLATVGLNRNGLMFDISEMPTNISGYEFNSVGGSYYTPNF